LEVDLHFWWQSHIYNNLQLEQQKHFQTTFMQPLTQKKNNASLTNLKMMMYYLVICALLSRNCALNIPKCLELVEQVITHTFIQAIFYSPYGLSFNQVYLGGTHLDKHDRLTCVFKCMFKLDLIFKFSNLKKIWVTNMNMYMNQWFFWWWVFGILWNFFWEKCWVSNVFY